MFSTFPDGSFGAGLPILRLGGGAALVVQGLVCFGDKQSASSLILAVVCFMSVAGFLLLIGFLTRFVSIVSVLVGVGYTFSWYPVSKVGPLVTPTTAAMSAVISAAVLCMGPGAISLDAQLFGRREIIIPGRPPED